MPITTTPSERVGRCTRMRRFIARFNRPESFVHTRSSAGFTIITYGFEFSVYPGRHFVAATNLIDVYVGGLRGKIDSEQAYPIIHTVRGVGFCIRAAA